MKIKPNYSEEFNDELKRLLEASKAGNFEFVLNRDNLSSSEQDIVDLLNQAINNYRTTAKISIQANQKAVSDEERINLMLDTSPICCQLWDRNFNPIACNEAGVKLYGLKNKQEYMDRFFELSPKYQPDGQLSSEKSIIYIKKAFEEGSCTFEWTHQLPDGSLLPAEVTLVRIEYGKENIVAGYTHDMREHKKMLQDIRETAEKLKVASNAKGAFLSNMSHEMRTPLNAIIGMAAIGKKAQDLEGKNRALKEIDIASAHLLGVINDVLDIAKIEADKLELSPIDFVFVQMLQKVINMIKIRMAELGQKLHLNVDKRIPELLVGDDQRLTQVITNILSNAIKFTPENGHIYLDAKLESESEDINCIQISIRDTGIGMTKEQKDKIFNSFEQALPNTYRKYGGTGLGLTITKRIIEMMNGQIWVESEPNQGTTFTFVVELKKKEKGTEDLYIKNEIQSKRDNIRDDFSEYKILLAEDVYINSTIIIELLADTKITIDAAENGYQAVEMFKKDPNRYSLIFMDVQMPEMDGHEATQYIRNLDIPWAKEIPIIAMTGNTFKEDIEHCISVGMNDHIAKPINIEEVFSLLRKYLQGTTIIGSTPKVKTLGSYPTSTLE